MSDVETPPPAPPQLATPQRRPGLLSRLLAALLVIIITTALALAAVAGLFFVLGFSPDTPSQIAENRRLLATSQAQGAALQQQNALLQTQVAGLERSSTDNRENLDELRRELADVVALRDQLLAGEARNATVVAEARSTRDQVVLYATTEAGRAALLDQLQRRSERIERFLERLSDIADDAALDLSGPTAAPTTDAAPAPPSTASPTPTPTQSSTSTPTYSPTPTPTRDT